MGLFAPPANPALVAAAISQPGAQACQSRAATPRGAGQSTGPAQCQLNCPVRSAARTLAPPAAAAHPLRGAPLPISGSMLRLRCPPDSGAHARQAGPDPGSDPAEAYDCWRSAATAPDRAAGPGSLLAGIQVWCCGRSTAQGYMLKKEQCSYKETYLLESTIWRPAAARPPYRPSSSRASPAPPACPVAL